VVSNFETAFAAQFNPSAIAQFSETTVYVPAGATATTATMVPLRETRMRFEAVSEQDCHEEMEAYLLSADRVTPIDLMAATGNAVDTCTIDSQVWQVRQIIERNVGGWHRLRLSTELLP
jgi:hypothetical protein